MIGAALSIACEAHSARSPGEKDRALSSMARMLWSMRSASFRFDNPIRVTPADVIGNASDEHRHQFGITGTSDPSHVLSQATRNHADVFASDRANQRLHWGR